jgi:hypothetical protein
MGLLDNYSPNGLGMSPKADYKHALIIDAVYSLIKVNINSKKMRVLQQTQLIPKLLNSKVPDVIVYKRTKDIYNDYPILFIEIEHRKREKKTEEKLIEEMKLKKVNEAFLYNYETGIWKKYVNTDIIKPKNNIASWSDILNLDLALFKDFYED